MEPGPFARAATRRTRPPGRGHGERQIAHPPDRPARPGLAVDRLAERSRGRVRRSRDAARTAGAMRVPPAEATRTSSCVGSLSVASRARRTSRSVSGRRPGRVGGEQLLGVEGVAFGAGRDPRQELRVGLGTKDGCELAASSDRSKRLSSMRSARPLRSCSARNGSERVTPMELVRSIGNEEDDGAVAQIASEEAEQARGSSGRPSGRPPSRRSTAPAPRDARRAEGRARTAGPAPSRRAPQGRALRPRAEAAASGVPARSTGPEQLVKLRR